MTKVSREFQTTLALTPVRAPVPRALNPKMNPAATYREVQGQMLRTLRSKIQSAPFTPEARQALARSIGVMIRGSSLILTTRHPAWNPLVEGVKRGPMRGVLKAKTPIPIILDNGKVIFRTATPQSLRSGGWVHPGRKPWAAMDTIKDQLGVYLLDKMGYDLNKQLRKTFGAR